MKMESDPDWSPNASSPSLPLPLRHMEVVETSSPGCFDGNSLVIADTSGSQEEIKPIGDIQTVVIYEKDESVCFDNWQHRHLFTFVKEEGKNITVQCNLCKPKVNQLSSSKKSTSNLIKHLRRKHPGKFDERLNRKGKVIESLPGQPGIQIIKQEKTLPRCLDPVKVHRLILNFIMEDVQSFALLRQPGFSRMVEGLSGRPWALDEVMLMADVERAFVHMRSLLVAALNRAQFLCTTADIWTVHNRSYLGITCHWIEEEELQRKSAALACTRLRGQHTYFSIAAKIHEIHVSYNIEHKVESVVTDNGCNFVKTFKEFSDAESDDYDYDVGRFEDLGSILDQRGEEELPSFLPQPLPSVTHLLHLIATRDLVQAVTQSSSCQLYYSVMAKSSNIWHKAHQSRSTLKAIVDLSELPLMVPAVNRWSIEYSVLLKLACLTSGQLSELCTSLGVLEPGPEEMLFLKEYVGVFRPLAFAFDLFQEEQKCFLGLVIPTLLTLKKKLSEKKTVTCFLQEVIDAVLEAVDARFQQLFDFPEAKMATTTTPQFRLWWLPELERQDMRQQLVARMAQVPVKKEAANDFAPIDSDDFFSYGPGSDSIAEPAAEAWKYLDRSSKSLDCLKDFPRVRKLFVKCNTTLPSSTSVLRLFHYKANIATQQSSRQSDDHFERLVLMAYNGNGVK